MCGAYDFDAIEINIRLIVVLFSNALIRSLTVIYAIVCRSNCTGVDWTVGLSTPIILLTMLIIIIIIIILLITVVKNSGSFQAFQLFLFIYILWQLFAHKMVNVRKKGLDYSLPSSVVFAHELYECTFINPIISPTLVRLGVHSCQADLGIPGNRSGSTGRFPKSKNGDCAVACISKYFDCLDVTLFWDYQLIN